jgi:hypothetical protein
MAIEALERYLVSRLYSTAFYIPTSTDSGDVSVTNIIMILILLYSLKDEKFYYRIRTLQFLQPDHLDLPNRKYNYIAFEMAAQGKKQLINAFHNQNVYSPDPQTNHQLTRQPYGAVNGQ